MKKLLVILLSLVLLTNMFGCTGGKGGDDTPNTPPVVDPNSGNKTDNNNTNNNNPTGNTENKDPSGNKNETGYGDSDDDMDWSANTLAGVRQGIFDDGAILGIAYLGYCDGPIGDGIIDIIGGTPYEEDFPFILDIDYDHYVQFDYGWHYLCLIPLWDCTVSINNGKSKCLYQDNEPIILAVSCVDDTKVTVTLNDKTTTYVPTLDNANHLVLNQDGLVKDVSIYETGYGDMNIEDDMWENSLGAIRQGIFDSNCVAGISFLGFYYGPIGDGIIDVIGNTNYVTDYPYILHVPFNHYVEAESGYAYFCITPFSDEVCVEITTLTGKTLYESEVGDPIILYSDPNDANVIINLYYEDLTVTYIPKIDSNGHINFGTVDYLKDTSIYSKAVG